MIKFYFKETFNLISRAKSFSFLSLLSMIISLLLIALYFIALNISSGFQKKLGNEFALNIFINDTLNNEDSSALKSFLNSKKYAREVIFIDKNKAAEIFINETGEDLMSLLDYNPLPASFILKISGEYIQTDSIKMIVHQLSNMKGVDEIVFKQEHLKKILDYINIIKKYLLIIAVILFMLTISVVYSTSKLLINSRRDEIETMKLVGAKLYSVKFPHIIYSGFIGLVAGLIVVFISNLYLSQVYKYININILEINNFSTLNNIIIFLSIGPAIGMIVTYITTRKITLKL